MGGFKKSLLIASALFFALAPGYATDEIIPVEAFSNLPNLSRPRLSPDGNQVAYFVDLQGRRALMIQPFDGEESQIIPSGENTNLTSFRWANNHTIVLQYGSTWKRFEFNTKTSETRVTAFNLKTREYTWLGQPKQSRTSNATIYTSQNERIVDMLPHDPKYILMQMDFELDGRSSVYKVNVKNGRKREIIQDRPGIQQWFTDQNSEVRLGLGYYDDEFRITFKNHKGNWESLNQVDWYKTYDIEGFTAQPNVIYVSGPSEHGTDGLYTLDLNSGKIIDTLFEHKDVDMSNIVTHPVTGVVIGVGYTTDFYRVKFFDKTMAKIQRSIAKVLKKDITTLTHAAKEQERYLFLSSSDQNPGTYYLYDRGLKALNVIAPVRAHIIPEQMGTVKMVNITARDSINIPSFLTFPAGKEDTKSLPAIILPHGGPFGVRDDAHWDYWAQFYASRGYIVLQPNFRGSGGYGRTHRYSGFNQWGGKMQDDLTDATKWLISEGYADPERICIVGGSYGGYASLMGLITEPDLYKCAISINGVTNLPRIKRDDKNNSIGGRNWIKRMGLDGVDDEQVSPYHRAQEIKVPVMLISAEDDTRVSYRQSGQMHTRLRELGKDSTYIKLDDGGHSLVTAKARHTLLTETEKFLQKHIGN
ncbi:alpha/beta hydrolase family protein [Kordiimonas laminariae]|uniref:alpha/beta hydrolase family protein n=1 Tax=Kordiimonas laminariae TaxID=2917717 RepID=UPI001FF36E0A|nr:prolyl oligopeptidase family serine peptidase [Kordiimonas laminariae]